MVLKFRYYAWHINYKYKYHHNRSLSFKTYRVTKLYNYAVCTIPTMDKLNKNHPDFRSHFVRSIKWLYTFLHHIFLFFPSPLYPPLCCSTSITSITNSTNLQPINSNRSDFAIITQPVESIDTELPINCIDPIRVAGSKDRWIKYRLQRDMEYVCLGRYDAGIKEQNLKPRNEIFAI